MWYSKMHHILFLIIVLCIIPACGPPPSDLHRQPRSPLLGTYSYTPSPRQTARSRLVFSMTQFPDAANPLFASSTADLELDNALWGQPVFYDQHFHVEADQLTEVPLPENGDVRDGGKTIVMHLRHDLRWSDGQPIVANDFSYWWHLNQDPNTGATVTGGYAAISSIDTPDAFTVVLHMKQPFGPYLFYLPYAAPQHVWGQLHPIDLQNTQSIYQAPLVTSGPYKLLQMSDGQRYVLVPNPYYTSTTFHGPFLSQLVYQTYNTSVALSTAAAQQEADVTMGYMEYDLPQLLHLPSSVQVLQTPTAAYAHLDFNMAQPLFHNVAVRRAVQMAIDVCGLLVTVLHTRDCDRRATQVEPLPSLFYDRAIHPALYDPGAARTLLAQAGWLSNAHGQLMQHGQLFRVRLVTTANNPVRAAIAARIQQNLQAIGVQVTIAYYPLNTFFGVYTRGGILATGAYDLALFTYADSPEPDDEYTVFSSSQIPTAAAPTLGNYGRINDPIIDQALLQGRHSIFFADRVAAYHRFLERLADQVYMIPLYTEINLVTVDKRVRNVIPHPNAAANTWNIADWWA